MQDDAGHHLALCCSIIYLFIYIIYLFNGLNKAQICTVCASASKDSWRYINVLLIVLLKSKQTTGEKD